jgi:hypothetical protein
VGSPYVIRLGVPAPFLLTLEAIPIRSPLLGLTNDEENTMPLPKGLDSIAAYLRTWASELGDRILQTYPPLHGFDDGASPLIGQLLRKPFPAQTLAIMGVVKRWNDARGAAVIAECGTGKTLISLGALHVHSGRKPFTALAMVPPQLVEKWAREAFLTLPRVRVFFVDGLRAPRSLPGRAAYYTHRVAAAEDGAQCAPAVGFDLRIPGSVHCGA